jgi:diguanylate cyclase (GGDEF)-like protein
MKLLVADDSSLYRTMLKRMLEAWGYEVVLAVDGHEAQRILDSNDAPSLAIVDCMMPGMSGLELCKQIRARRQGYVYTILLSAANHENDVLQGFELGADDYLGKPFKELELIARLRVGERIIKIHEELVEAYKILEFEAAYDSSLRIWNRRTIMDLLSKEVGRAKRSQTPLSIFLADLDFFKRVNDSYGHLVGDEVLRRAAERMSNEVRESDHLGRYGGEEFLAVLPACTAEGAVLVAERVRQSIGNEPLVKEVAMTVSIGVAQLRPGQEIHDLLHEADIAMYRAKQSGRNRVEVEKASELPSAYITRASDNTFPFSPTPLPRSSARVAG